MKRLEEYLCSISNCNNEMEESLRLLQLGIILRRHKYHIAQFCGLTSAQVIQISNRY